MVARPQRIEAKLAIGIPRLGVGKLIVTDGSFLLHPRHSLLAVIDHFAKVGAQILRIESTSVPLPNNFTQI